MGSTRFRLGYLVEDRDHPHIHGEHPLALIGEGDFLGSPPYTWGAPVYN